VPAALEAADRISGGVTVAPGAQTLDISWAAVAGATDYTVRVDGSVRATVTGTSTQLTGLTNGNQLAVDVQPSNGDRSRPVLATVGPAAPGTPTLISGALRGTSTSAVLDLNASVAGAPAPRYAILRDGVSIGTVDMGLSATPTTTAIGIGAMPTVETHWQIRGVDDLGRSSGASNAITVGTGRPAPPAGVTGLGAQLADDQALLIWDDLGTAYTYRVSVAGAVVASPHSAGAVLPAPAAGESRTYTVVAVDAWGQNGPAATTTFRRPGKPELTVEPSVVGATVAGRTVSTPDAFTGADTVTHAWRACDADGCVPVAGDVTHLITAAEVGKRLTVEATATNAVGVTTAVSPQSAVVSAADVAAPVELAVVQRLAAGGMNLWQLPLAEGHPAFGTPDLVRSLDHGGTPGATAAHSCGPWAAAATRRRSCGTTSGPAAGRTPTPTRWSAT
jgi:hypothetical protein